MTSKFSGSEDRPYQQKKDPVGKAEEKGRMVVLARLTFRASPALPKPNHEVFQILESQGLLIDFLPVKGLTEPPTSVHTAHGLQPLHLLVSGPIPVTLRLTSLLAPADAARGDALGGQQGRLGALEKNLVVQAGAGAAAKGHAQVHEVGELGEPLVGLAGAHAPAQDGAGVGDAQVGGDEAVLGRDVVAEGDVGERGAGREVGLHVGRGRGLAVAEEGGDDDEVLGGGEGLVLADEPWGDNVNGLASGHRCSHQRRTAGHRLHVHSLSEMRPLYQVG